MASSFFAMNASNGSSSSSVVSPRPPDALRPRRLPGDLTVFDLFAFLPSLSSSSSSSKIGGGFLGALARASSSSSSSSNIPRTTPGRLTALVPTIANDDFDDDFDDDFVPVPLLVVLAPSSPSSAFAAARPRAPARRRPRASSSPPSPSSSLARFDRRGGIVVVSPRVPGVDGRARATRDAAE
tara:strand:+ start:2060 stop:2608 length:549 start_codon:yes stop_codon:yes gene_type:complete